MRIRGAHAAAHADAEVDADRRVRPAVPLDPLHQPAHAELLGRHGELVVGEIRALREKQIPREGVRLVEHAVGPPPERELLGRLDHPELLAVLGDRVELRVLEEDRPRLRELARGEVLVRRDALAVVAPLLQALEDPFEEVHLLALLDLALVRKRAVGVLEVEVVIGFGGPPALHEVAVEAGVEPDRREPVGGQKDRERPLRRREEEAREIDHVHRVRQPHSREPVLDEVRLERLRASLVPFERETVVARRGEAVVVLQEEGRGLRAVDSGRDLGVRAGSQRASDEGSAGDEQGASVECHHVLRRKSGAMLSLVNRP